MLPQIGSYADCMENEQFLQGSGLVFLAESIEAGLVLCRDLE